MALLLLLAVVVVSYVSFRDSTRQAALVTHSREVLERLTGLRSALETAEADHRSFLLTDERRFLDDYLAASEALDGSLHTLDHLSLGNPPQQARLEALHPVLAAHMALLRRSLLYHESGDSVAARGMLRAGQMLATLEESRGRISEMLSHEYALLVARAAAAEQSARRARTFILAGGILGLGLVTASAYMLRRDALARERVEAELREAHAELERRVEARTAELRESERRFRSLVSNLPGAVYRVEAADGEDWTVVYFSDAVEEITGYPASDFIENRVQSFAGITHPDDRESVHRSMDEAWRRREPSAMTYRIVRRDGEIRWVMERGQTVRDETGRVQFHDGVIFDVTERQLAAEQQQAREAAEAASLAKSRFLANMSHELRTPLSAVLGFSELLADDAFGALNQRQKKYVANIQTSGRHLLQLVNDVLDLAKIEAGRMALEFSAFEPAEALADVIRATEPLAAAKGHALVVDAEPGLPLITADRAKVKQILYNLLSNAIKFTPESGKIVVRLSRLSPGQVASGSTLHGATGGILFEVSDSGIGIPAEAQSRIFTEFEQLDSSYGRRQQGTGLGLALTQRLVQGHEGWITVESAPGQGSTFRVALPLIPSTVEAFDSSREVA